MNTRPSSVALQVRHEERRDFVFLRFGLGQGLVVFVLSFWLRMPHADEVPALVRVVQSARDYISRAVSPRRGIIAPSGIPAGKPIAANQPDTSHSPRPATRGGLFPHWWRPTGLHGSPDRAQRQRLPAGNGPNAFARLSEVEDSREQPLQLDSSRQLTLQLVGGADRGGFCLGNGEHR